jgi:hypothetical protein
MKAKHIIHQDGNEDPFAFGFESLTIGIRIKQWCTWIQRERESW